MKSIKKYVHQIDDELESAEDYAEKYIEFKANGKGETADMYKTMAKQELDHSSNIHSIAVSEIEKISAVFTAPAEMREKWEMTHEDFIRRSSWVKQMLSM